MAENKTQPGNADPVAFLDGVPNERRRQDGLAVLDMMKSITKLDPVMWGPSMIGFGQYHYKYASGREGDALAVGFSPRSSALALYGLTIAPGSEDLLARLGKHRKGAACLYINSLSDVDTEVLGELIRLGHAHMTTGNFTTG
ncbi:DUF1801 domain-containing protein [Arthrobacter sp. Br18]|uniref:DUF1801 domain-containing protein n=1 Tax=Arthrobacter sp. Br18 TaxID=1312954 RepID=UPI00047A1EB8|nr:DUF1801 domain-containing protein [Arthrobacter sp. Br18]